MPFTFTSRSTPCNSKMNDVYENVFADDVHRANESITDENRNQNIPSSTCFLRENHFIVGYQNASTPDLLSSENQHTVSLNISPALSPLNTSILISDISPFPQPINRLPLPAKGHGEVCNDFCCCTHDEADYSNCPLINTVVSSCQSCPPVPRIRCRGKKRIRNYDD